MTRLSISRAWDESRAVLAQDGKLIGTVALAFFVLPGTILNVVMPGAHQAPSPTAMPKPSPWMLLALIPVLIALVGQLSVIRLSMGPHVSVGEAITHGARRILIYVGAWLLWTVPFFIVGSVLYAAVAKDPQHPPLIAVIALFGLTILGVFLAIRLILMSAVASAEPEGPVAVLRRSWELTQGSWWRLFAFLLACVVASMILLFAGAAIATVIARLVFGDVSPASLGGLLIGIVGQLISAFISVILFVMLARIYVQLAGRDHTVSVPSSGI